MKNDDIVEVVEINATTRAIILQDSVPESPAATSEQFGKIAYKSSRYELGTERVDSDRMDAIAEGIKNGTLIGMPVYAYVHSGITISTTPFGDKFDSGQCGFVYATKESAEFEFGRSDITVSRALKLLVSEVEEFDQYVRGNVYGVAVQYLVDGEWKEDEAEFRSWGLYGIESAKSWALSMIPQSDQQVETGVSPRG